MKYGIRKAPENGLKFDELLSGQYGYTLFVGVYALLEWCVELRMSGA